MVQMKPCPACDVNMFKGGPEREAHVEECVRHLREEFLRFRDIAHAAWKVQNHVLRNLPVPDDPMKRACLSDLWTALVKGGFLHK